MKPSNAREEVQFEVFSLSFKNFHRKVGEINEKESLDLEEGSYKIKAADGNREYRKIVLLEGDLSVEIDFAEKYTPPEKKSGLKLIVSLLLASLLISIVMYYLGIPQYLESLIF